MTQENEEKEKTKEVDLKKYPITKVLSEFGKLGDRFEKSIEREEEHYEEYKYFEKRTVKFQEDFPYDRLNWFGKFMFWLMCKSKKKK